MQVADGRPLLLAGLFAPVLGWVLFNIGESAFLDGSEAARCERP